jgi:cell division ATPase FtsA
MHDFLGRCFEMMIVYRNMQFTLPANKLGSKRSRGMVKVSTGVVTDNDVRRVDQVAQDIIWGGFNPICINSRRLYFELDNGVKVEDPIGQPSQRLECVWEFMTVYEHELVAVA